MRLYLTHLKNLADPKLLNSIYFFIIIINIHKHNFRTARHTKNIFMLVTHCKG